MNSMALLLLLPFSMLNFEDKSSYPALDQTELKKINNRVANLKYEVPAIKFSLLRATKQPLENWYDIIQYSNSSIVKTFHKEIEHYAMYITTNYDIQTYLLDELKQYKE